MRPLRRQRRRPKRQATGPFDFMIEKYTGFIAEYENAVPDEFCDSIVSFFDKCVNDNTIYKQYGQDTNGPSKRMDSAVFLESSDYGLSLQLKNFLWQAFESYKKKFAILSETSFSNYACKIQKTDIGEGFHIWHFEKLSIQNASSGRAVAWMVYLNDIEDGQGETEFLYQHIRLKPKKGTICFFPADWTHTHRGNTMLNGQKYIATGWIDFL